ncbi:MAG: glycoside hydrolase family 15 protein [Acidobacteria bacterium]|nr:glycoside hydrolase family 15 protein [Acidobacteriota bacterium]
MTSDVPRTAHQQAIGDYAVIGNCRTAALVGLDGSIDWLCVPRFDSPSIFGALLDASRGGRCLVRVAGTNASTRRYLANTNVLETTFVSQSGTVRLTDLMPVTDETHQRTRLAPDGELLRTIECIAGDVDVDVLCEPRPDYGRSAVRIDDRGPLGFVAEAQGQLVVIRADAPLTRDADGRGLRGRLRLRQGERRYVSLSWTAAHPAVLPVLGAEAAARVAESVAWWRHWADRCRYEGPYRSEVVRSALALKLMSYAPSGAIVAAPTTSLPEQIGGPRNWDYRYCWLRDASMTLRGLSGLGYADEGCAFLSWLLHATRLTWPELQILYDVFGETHLPELELDHLDGYAASRPVRIGNDATGQLQLDVYGEVLDAVWRFVRMGGRLDRATARMLVGLGGTVVRRWREPDEGIWEIRSGRRHHTFSKAMCWVALDRLLALHAGGHVRGAVGHFEREREAIRAEIETRGYNAALDSYVATFDGGDVDASLLLLGLYRYADPQSARMRSTFSRVHERLGRNAMMYRYLDTDDGLPPGEGAFGIAGFWAVECRALGGDVAGARRDFEALCGRANDVGLFAEEYDPDTGAALGNFPQAFTHVGLINAALTLAACEPGREAAAGSTRRQQMITETL